MSKTAPKTSNSGYRKLQRNELAMFNKEQQNIILEIVAMGAEGRMSGNGHAILRGPTGRTMWVSRNTGSGHTAMSKLRTDIRQLFPKRDDVEDMIGRLTGNPSKKTRPASKKPDQPYGDTRTTDERPAQIDEQSPSEPEVPPVLDYRIEPFMSTTNKQVAGEKVVEASKTIEKVVWADGTVKFKCKFCDYARDSHKSVIPHLGSHREIINEMKLKGELYATPKELDRLRKQAAEEKVVNGVIEPAGDKHMPPKPPEAVEPARVSTKGVVECDVDRQPIEVKHHEPIDHVDGPTDRQRLEAIRDLLGTDPRVKLLEDEIELLKVQLLEAEERASACAARAEELEGSIHALHSMIGDVVKKPTKEDS